MKSQYVGAIKAGMRRRIPHPNALFRQSTSKKQRKELITLFAFMLARSRIGTFVPKTNVSWSQPIDSLL